jgi:putative transposase
MIAQTKALEDENRQLKKVFAELSMQNELLKAALGKSRSAISATGDGRNSGGATRDQHRYGLPDLRGQRDVLSLQPASECREPAAR